MDVTVRLFASLREYAGAGTVALQLVDGATVADAIEQLRGGALSGLPENAPFVAAVAREYVKTDHPLSEGDELALVPPVSGGMGEVRLAEVAGEPLDVEAVRKLVADPSTGATVVFLGTTREVPSLEYEAYVEMARERLAAIVAEAIERHGLCAAAAEHRVGRVPRSEASVIVAASAPHRAEAFAGAREIIDEIKRRAPIWKREEGDWVAGRTPPTGS
jgi:MoaE-MoaD fusion protein